MRGKIDMKFKKFDVVELNNNNKARIIDVKNNKYYIEEVASNGISLENKEIVEQDIKKVIFC